MAYQRPAFWRVPHQRPDPDDEPRYYGQRRGVTPGTPAGKQLARGDIIAKIDDYDARDLRHEDAQNLFRNAPKQIKLAVQRDVDREGHRVAALAPRSPAQSALPPPFRTPSPLPSAAWRSSESAPQAYQQQPYQQQPYQQQPYQQQQFQPQVEGEYRTILLSPNARYEDGVVDESITSQPYRTTPLVLPGAKVRREPGPTESYLRHHPNPAMRAPPHHDLRDTLMKQKVAESVLQRVVGEETNKVVHKQFNSPINLYSEQNIANSIRQQTSPLPSNGYYGRPNVVKSHKPTLQYDPAKSETYRALQEQSLDNAREMPTPATQVFTPPTVKKPVPPKPTKQLEARPSGKQTTFVNSLHEEHIQQSNSFKRLMYNVLGDTEF